MSERRPMPIPPAHPLMGTGEIVVFDLETTGRNATEDEITQVAAARLGGWQMRVVDTFCTYVNPGRPIPRLARKLTGITDDHVAGAPTPAEALSKLSEFASGSTLFGHDIYRFDFRFIRKHTASWSCECHHIRFIDTMDIVQLLWHDFSRLDHGLDEIAARLNAVIPPRLRHKADGDALLLARIFQRLQTIPELDLIATSVPIHDALLPSPPSDLQRN